MVAEEVRNLAERTLDQSISDMGEAIKEEADDISQITNQ
ncbi:hypothetical protein [Campylobacter subantarcticus]|nr:hypothetical protein [Campylobacter subantarcticus]